MKKYNIIYADPAWLYKCGKNHLAKKSMINGKDDIQYDSMTIKDMENLPINNISSDDSLLFMWVTSPFMKIGIDLLDKWNFLQLLLSGINKNQIQCHIHYQNAKFVLWLKKGRYQNQEEVEKKDNFYLKCVVFTVKNQMK